MKNLTGILILCAAAAGCGGGGGGSEDGDNNAPQISGRPDAIVRAGGDFSFTPAASDSDGDRLEFSVENLPSWAFFDAGTGTITGFPGKPHYGAYEDIVIRVSDGIESAELRFDLDVLPPLLGKRNFVSEGTVIPGKDGYTSQGTLVMTVDGKEKRFENADLQLEFDAEGNLVEMAGETLIPSEVSDHLSLDAQVKTRVGLYSGAEINADPDIDIRLKEEQKYFVYYYGQELDMTLRDRDGSGGETSLTLSTPASGEILFITDPTDVFYYYYGEIPFAGAGGRGESDNGLIPFEPVLDYDRLDRFDGHVIETASVGLGVKIFDFFEIAGTRVIRQPDYAQIYLDDPFFEDPANSLEKVEYKMGINGDANFAFAVLGFGVFEFDLTEASTTLDVGFDRQHMAMRSRTAPDVSWVPDGFLFVPKSETVGDWFVDGSGEYEISLSSTFESRLPAATIGGSMALVNGEITLSGSVDNGDRPLGVSATFFPGGVDVAVEVYADFEQGITQRVTSALDDKIAEWQRAFDDLQKATADFEFELSLRGAREAIPAVVDNAISILDAVPGAVRNAVDRAVVNYVNNYEVCTLGICSNPLDPLVDEAALGDRKGEDARRIAADAIAPFKTALNTLKSAVNLPDDQFRAAIKAALQAVYDRRRFSRRIRISHDFPLVGTITVYDATIVRDILTGSNLTLIETALANVDNIEATGSIVISAQQVFEALPVEDAINDAKQEVQNGLARIPTLDGVGYVVDNGVYSAYAVLDGVPYDIEFNVLSPAELAAGIPRLIADQLAR